MRQLQMQHAREACQGCGKVLLWRDAQMRVHKLHHRQAYVQLLRQPTHDVLKGVMAHVQLRLAWAVQYKVLGGLHVRLQLLLHSVPTCILHCYVCRCMCMQAHKRLCPGAVYVCCLIAASLAACLRAQAAHPSWFCMYCFAHGCCRI